MREGLYKRQYSLKITKVLYTTLISILLLTSCSSGDKKDDVEMMIFPLFGQSTDDGLSEQVEEIINRLTDSKPSIEVIALPIFTYDKLLIEIGYGDSGIVVLPTEMFPNYVESGMFVPLDEIVNPELFPDGIGDDLETGESHLYGIPADQIEAFTNNGIEMKQSMIVIRRKYDKIPEAKQVMKALMAGQGDKE